MNRLLLGLFFWACFLTAQAAERKLKVLTTCLSAYCIAANVAGTHADVENLLPAGASLHDFQLTPSELRKINTADVVLVNGLGMESFIDRALANSSPGASSKIVTLSSGLDHQLIADKDKHHDEPGHHHSYDPHIWLDPTLAAHCVTNVLGALQKADSANGVTFARNAATYVASLKALDAELAATLATITNNAFITYHNAFQYFARRYHLNLAGVVERIPEVSPSPRERAELTKIIREKNVKALFVEPGDHGRLGKQIAGETKIKLAELDPLETGDFTPAAYEEGMRRNAAALKKALAP